MPENRFAKFAGALGKVVACALMLQSASLSIALDFIPEPDRAEWALTASTLECRLTQSIPYFGEAVFRQRAGESLQFQLNSSHHILSGEANLRIESPPWRPSMEPITLGTVPVRAGATPVQLNAEMAEKLLSAMFEGLSPVFDGLPSSGLRGSMSVGLAAVKFRPTYSSYRNCQSKLLPVSFAAVQRTRVGYEAGGWELNEAQRRQLDLLLTHLKLSKGVTTIYVDGYTDDSGRRTTNLELSKKRAEAVTNYLVEGGVASEMITMRYHGSRFPVARGRGAAARAQNRRVTVRLERG